LMVAAHMALSDSTEILRVSTQLVAEYDPSISSRSQRGIMGN